jgi:hypothetical protein
MLTRDPDAYLFSLYEVFNRRLEKDRKLLPAVLSFHAAKTAVILRMKAIDNLADKFERFANQPNRSVERVKRSPEENQLLFDFFANGLAALESFTFGSYYLGVGIDGNKFDINKVRKKIKPEAVLKSFKNFARRWNSRDIRGSDSATASMNVVAAVILRSEGLLGLAKCAFLFRRENSGSVILKLTATLIAGRIASASNSAASR